MTIKLEHMDSTDHQRARLIYRHAGDDSLWRAVGWITEPAVILESVKDPERQRTVICLSRISDEYTRLVPEGAER